MNSETNAGVETEPSGPDLAARIAAARRETATRTLTVLSIAALLIVGGLAYLLFGSGVQVQVQPESAGASAEVRLIEGFGFISGRKVIALPGEIELAVSAPRFESKTVTTAVVAGGSTMEVTLDPLPDVLRVQLTQPLDQAEVLIDGTPVGRGRATEIRLRPGIYLLSVREPNHVEYAETITIDGGGDEVLVSVTLDSATQKLLLISEPAGARVLVDNTFVDTTPVQIDLLEGHRDLRFELEGYVTEERVLNISLDRQPELGVVKLSRNPGVISLTTEPSNATVLVGGAFRGSSPTRLNLSPDIEHTITVNAPGYETTRRTVQVSAGSTRSLNIELAPRIGVVEIRSTPSADIYIDGEPRGQSPMTVSLPSMKHMIELKRDGYRSTAAEITPDPNITKVVDETLFTLREAMIRDAKPTLISADGQVLVLVQPGALTMGAPRSDPGQRANEVGRDVRITRHFYIATKEVTANTFSAFLNRSGTAPASGATGDAAANMTWQDAARFCNWLSALDGLRPVYQFVNGRYQGFNIDANGYRLPTEAEWAWAARYEGGQRGQPTRFSWGQDMPIPPDAGNFADQSAVGVVNTVIPNYEDGVASMAPVGRYRANGLGLHDLAGNASEWVHDVYEIASLSRPDIEIDRMGPASGQQHVIRGSSWRSSSLTQLRLTYREPGTDGRDDVGFRVARWLGARNGE